MQLSNDTENRLNRFATLSHMSRNEAIAFILEDWLSKMPAAPPAPPSISPEELNASNDG